jgi:hypothetical protein
VRALRCYYLNSISLIPITIIPDHTGQMHVSVQRFYDFQTLTVKAG